MAAVTLLPCFLTFGAGAGLGASLARAISSFTAAGVWGLGAGLTSSTGAGIEAGWAAGVGAGGTISVFIFLMVIVLQAVGFASPPDKAFGG